MEVGGGPEAVGSTEASSSPNSLARASPRTRSRRPPRAGEHGEQIVFHGDVPRRRPPLVCQCWSLRCAKVCALIPGPAPRKHAPPRAVLPPRASWGTGGVVAPIAESRPGFSEQYHFLFPSPSRRTPAAMILTHGRWTRFRGTGRDNLRAPVGSTRATRKLG